MRSQNSNCAILADRNTVTSEGIRGLLETEFDSVYLVANAYSLTEGVERLRPRLVVVDQFVGLDALQETLHTVHTLSSESRVIALVNRDHSMFAEAMLAAGASEMSEAFKAVGLHRAMLLIPVALFLTLLALVQASRCFSRDAAKMRQGMADDVPVPV